VTIKHWIISQGILSKVNPAYNHIAFPQILEADTLLTSPYHRRFSKCIPLFWQQEHFYQKTYKWGLVLIWQSQTCPDLWPARDKPTPHLLTKNSWKGLTLKTNPNTTLGEDCSRIGESLKEIKPKLFIRSVHSSLGSPWWTRPADSSALLSGSFTYRLYLGWMGSFWGRGAESELSNNS
jgi:hypothetical protein